MALHPIDVVHLAQIQAGTVGRTKGHNFEKQLTADLNGLVLTRDLAVSVPDRQHLFNGHPASLLVRYIVSKEHFPPLTSLQAWWLGGLATFREGDKLLTTAGTAISKSKSDVVVELCHAEGKIALGVSVKTCSKATPTNDQLFCSTASAFCALLRRNGLEVSNQAEQALKMFCGDSGFRPADKPAMCVGRVSDPDRWFWEELPEAARKEWEAILTTHQREVSTVLLQKAYKDDPYAPSYLLHQTVKYSDIQKCPVALFTIEEVINYSCSIGHFSTKEYYIRKGRFKHDPNPHLAPRFGYIQFQRLGNKQNATQLQFNLKAGYFNNLPSGALEEDLLGESPPSDATPQP